MHRQQILDKVKQFSKDLDTTTLKDFQFLQNDRLEYKREAGRTGWELMEAVELADLMCKVMNKRNGGNFYLDLANLLMFAHALEIDPTDIMDVLEAHLGSSFNDRKDIKPSKKDGDTTPRPSVVSSVSQLPDKAKCIIYRVGHVPEHAVWNAQHNKFVIDPVSGITSEYSPHVIAGYQRLDDEEAK